MLGKLLFLFIASSHFAFPQEIGLSDHPSQQRYIDENKDKVAMMCTSKKFNPKKLEWVSRPACDKSAGFVKSDKNLDCEGGWCTVTLITPKHVLTAGHCLQDNTCPDANFLFGVTDASPSIAPEKTRKCKSVTARKNVGHLDYAILELDEPVDFVKPAMSLRRSGTPDPKGIYFSYGHPQGRPLHATRGTIAGGEVNQNSSSWNPFASELLTMQSRLIATGGQSGSSVFNKGLLEGIITAETTDGGIHAEPNHEKGCWDIKQKNKKAPSTYILSIKTILNDSRFRPELYYNIQSRENASDGSK